MWIRVFYISAHLALAFGSEVNFTVTQDGDQINSSISLRCEPYSSQDRPYNVTITFRKTGKQISWQGGSTDSHLNILPLRAFPFMRGNVTCDLKLGYGRLLSPETRVINMTWRARPRRILFNETEEGLVLQENDTLTVTCEVEWGTPHTKNQMVIFSGFRMNRSVSLGKKQFDSKEGWSLSNLTTKVRLTDRYDGKNIGCSLDGKTLTKKLTVQYAPKNLSIEPSHVITSGQVVRCTAAGNPKPTVKIYMKDKRLGWEERQLNGSYEIVVGENLQESTYELTCEAWNRLGTKERLTAVLVVSADSKFVIVASVFGCLLVLVIGVMVGKKLLCTRCEDVNCRNKKEDDEDDEEMQDKMTIEHDNQFNISVTLESSEDVSAPTKPEPSEEEEPYEGCNPFDDFETSFDF